MPCNYNEAEFYPARTYLQGVYHNYIPLTMQYLIDF